jgi:predicted NACHT family NTPase
LKPEEDNINVKSVYISPKLKVVTESNSDNRDRNNKMETEKSYIKGYHEIFQTKQPQQIKKIYILGDVGTGKSTFCKMMIDNWCCAITGTKQPIDNENKLNEIDPNETNVAYKVDNDVSQIGQYEFLFYIQLQGMCIFTSDIRVMVKQIAQKCFSPQNTGLIDKLFEEDSRGCLILADGLDEWTPPEEEINVPHVSYGIPNGDGVNNATVMILSRPSAKGILNLKTSEFDLKLQLLGISSKSLKAFIERYISNVNSTGKSYSQFMGILKSKKVQHVEKTPLLLQQLLWLYCNDKEIGNSVSETYCQILNTVFGWSDRRNKGRDNDTSQSVEDYKNVTLPKMLHTFPRLKNKKTHLITSRKSCI